MSKVYTHNDFTLRDPCTYGDNNWCGYADSPCKAVIYGEMSKDIETSPFEDMVKLDIHYLKNWSLWLDMKIILRTIPVMLKGEGC